MGGRYVATRYLGPKDDQNPRLDILCLMSIKFPGFYLQQGFLPARLHTPAYASTYPIRHILDLLVDMTWIYILIHS